jgi:hypothetical protein
MRMPKQHYPQLRWQIITVRARLPSTCRTRTRVAGVTGLSGTQPCEVWYKPTPISGSPGNISTANGWVLGASGTFTGVANTTTSTVQTFLSNTSITIPANTTYAMAVFANGQRYSTIPAGNTTFTAGGVSYLSGTNIGYGGGTPPATPGNSPRGWIGELTFIAACFSPTNLAANNVTINSADISWSPVVNSFGYEYVVDQNPGSPAGAGTPTTSTTQSVSGLTINTTYYFHVRNKCNSAFSAWVNFPFTTADAYCKAPNNILFSNITSTSAGVLWSQMPTTTSYQYYVSENLAFPLAGNTGIQNTATISTTLTGLTPDTKYYFFIRSKCLGGNDSSTWKVDSFVTKAPCNQPVATTTGFGQVNQNVYWNSIKTAVAYEYRVDGYTENPAFGVEVYDTTVAVSLPADNSNQYLHLRAKCNSQFAFSEWTTLTLRETPVSVNDVQGKGISTYPNPAHDVLYVKNALNKPYRILDVRGVVLSSGIVNGEDVALPLGNMAPGVYILQVGDEFGKHISRFVKQ